MSSSLVLDRFLRLPHGEYGARYELPSRRMRRHAMGSYLYFRWKLASDARNETLRTRGRECELLRFPEDPALPGLDPLVRARAEPIAWRPGKRAVLREQRDGTVLYWKVFAARNYTAQRALLLRSEAAPLFEAGFVRVVEVRDDLRALAFAEARGLSLHEWLARGHEPDAAALARGVRRIATAGFRLLASDVLPRFGFEAECESLRRATSFASMIRPELTRRFEEGMGRLAVPSDAGPIGFLHRDLHDKQLFVLDVHRADEPEWIDADTLAVGPRAIDETNLAAHVWLRGCQGVAARGGELARALLDAFDLDPRQAGSAARCYLATSLLRLAAVYAIRPRSSRVAAELLGAAESVLGDGVLP